LILEGGIKVVEKKEENFWNLFVNATLAHSAMIVVFIVSIKYLYDDYSKIQDLSIKFSYFFCVSLFFLGVGVFYWALIRAYLKGIYLSFERLELSNWKKVIIILGGVGLFFSPFFLAFFTILDKFK
jgi:uncharacterized membrane protein